MILVMAFVRCFCEIVETDSFSFVHCTVLCSFSEANIIYISPFFWNTLYRKDCCLHAAYSGETVISALTHSSDPSAYSHAHEGASHADTLSGQGPL